MGFSKRLFFILGVFALFIAMGGLMVGKQKEKAYLNSMDSHHDFTLLDDTDDLFQLNKFPKEQRLLLIFTPDGIPPATVKAFFDFSRHLPEFSPMKIKVKMVTRTNREIVANFKRASGFEERVLLDVGGAVGRAAGAWPTLDPVNYWTYVLVDSQFRIFWSKMAPTPLSFEEVRQSVSQP